MEKQNMEKQNKADKELYIKDLESEKIVLGTIIQDRNALNQVRELLTEECFYEDFHKDIFRAIKAIDSRGERPDMLAVPKELRKMNIEFDAYVFALLAGCHTFDLYPPSAYLHDLAIRRKFYEIGQYLVSNASNESEDIADVTQTSIEKLSNLFTNSGNEVQDIKNVFDLVYNRINLNRSSKGLTGSLTGFDALDDKCGGLQRSDLIVIAADTSQGKTSLAMSICVNSALTGTKIAIYSMEMESISLGARMISAKSGVSSSSVLYTAISDEQIALVDKGVKALEGINIYFDDRSTSGIDKIINSIRSMKIKKGIDGAVVDYLQILNVNMKGSNIEQQMGDVARKLKNLAKELGIWIIALSQLNRDKLDVEPNLTRIRNSGQITEAADVVLLIYRPEVYNKHYSAPFANVSPRGTAMIDIAKGRNVGLSKFICGFNAQTTNFYNLTNVPTIGSGPNAQEDEEVAPF